METTTPIERLRWCSGWTGAGMLIVLYIGGEVLTSWIGGNLGSFLFVTWHFIVMPLFAAVVMLLTMVVVTRPASTLRRLALLSSIIVELAIIFIALSGEPGLARFLDFQ